MPRRSALVPSGNGNGMTNKTSASSRWKLEWGAAALLGLLTLGAHGSRLVHAGGLWRDEAGAVSLATLSSPDDVLRLFPHEAFPLAVPATIRLYAVLTGGSDQAFRWLGMAIGLAMAGVLWLSARVTGGTLPLLSLALISGNSAFVVFGDSMRGYGLGSLSIVLALVALTQLLRRPALRTATLAFVALVGAAQCLLGNSALVAALCTAAIVTALRCGRKGTALVVLGIGVAAGLSVLPYALSLKEALAWSVVLPHNIGLRRIVTGLGASAGPARAVWLVLAALALTSAVRVSKGAIGDLRNDPVWMFSALALVLGIAAQLLFLDVLDYTPRVWYYLPLLALVAASAEPLVAALCRGPRAAWFRIGFAIVLAVALVALNLPRLSERMTNADLVAHQLTAAAAADDLIVVSPWHLGISFTRYYQGPTRWTTLPDIADHRVHRYDLLKIRMVSPHPIEDVVEGVRRTLADGHRVWLVGQLPLPTPGEGVPVLVPAPGDLTGWEEKPYVESWALQFGAFLRDHAASLEPVAIPSVDRVSTLEDMSVAVARGWRRDGAR